MYVLCNRRGNKIKKMLTTNPAAKGFKKTTKPYFNITN